MNLLSRACDCTKRSFEFTEQSLVGFVLNFGQSNFLLKIIIHRNKAFAKSLLEIFGPMWPIGLIFEFKCFGCIDARLQFAYLKRTSSKYFQRLFRETSFVQSIEFVNSRMKAEFFETKWEKNNATNSSFLGQKHPNFRGVWCQNELCHSHLSLKSFSPNFGLASRQIQRHSNKPKARQKREPICSRADWAKLSTVNNRYSREKC